MFVVKRKEGENFNKLFNAFRTNTRDLRLQQKVREGMNLDKKARKPNRRRKKQIAQARERYRDENLRKSFYA